MKTAEEIAKHMDDVLKMVEHLYGKDSRGSILDAAQRQRRAAVVDPRGNVNKPYETIDFTYADIRMSPTPRQTTLIHWAEKIWTRLRGEVTEAEKQFILKTLAEEEIYRMTEPVKYET